MSEVKLTKSNEQSMNGATRMSEFEVLKTEVEQFVEARDWSVFHTPKNLAMCLSVEASELVELYQWQLWQTDVAAPGGGPPLQSRVAEEVGDIMISLLNFCRAAGIDPVEAARQKLVQVKQKYPVSKVRGSAVRPGHKT